MVNSGGIVGMVEKARQVVRELSTRQWEVFEVAGRPAGVRAIGSNLEISLDMLIALAKNALDGVVYVVGCDFLEGWTLVGIFVDQHLAEMQCKHEHHFVVPVLMNEAGQMDITTWQIDRPGFYRPNVTKTHGYHQFKATPDQPWPCHCGERFETIEQLTTHLEQAVADSGRR